MTFCVDHATNRDGHLLAGINPTITHGMNTDCILTESHHVVTVSHCQRTNTTLTGTLDKDAGSVITESDDIPASLHINQSTISGSSRACCRHALGIQPRSCYITNIHRNVTGSRATRTFGKHTI